MKVLNVARTSSFIDPLISRLQILNNKFIVYILSELLPEICLILSADYISAPIYKFAVFLCRTAFETNST